MKIFMSDEYDMIQGISKSLFVSGLDQISKYSNTYDIANAILKKIDDDTHIYTTGIYIENII